MSTSPLPYQTITYKRPNGTTVNVTVSNEHVEREKAKITHGGYNTIVEPGQIEKKPSVNNIDDNKIVQNTPVFISPIFGSIPISKASDKLGYNPSGSNLPSAPPANLIGTNKSIAGTTGMESELPGTTQGAIKRSQQTGGTGNDWQRIQSNAVENIIKSNTGNMELGTGRFADRGAKKYKIGYDPEKKKNIYMPKTEELVVYGLNPQGGTQYNQILSEYEGEGGLEDTAKQNISIYQQNINYLEKLSPEQIQNQISEAKLNLNIINKLKENETVALMKNGVETSYKKNDAVKEFENYIVDLNQLYQDYQKLPEEKNKLTESEQQLSNIVNTKNMLKKYAEIGYIVEKSDEGYYNIRSPSTDETFAFVYGEDRPDILWGSELSTDFMGIKGLGRAFQYLVTGDKSIQESHLQELKRGALNISRQRELGENVLGSIVLSPAVEEGALFLAMEFGTPLLLSGVSSLAVKGSTVLTEGGSKISSAIAKYTGTLSPTGQKIFGRVVAGSGEVATASKYLLRETGASFGKVASTKIGGAVLVGNMFMVMEAPHLVETAYTRPQDIGAELGGSIGGWVIGGLAIKEGMANYYTPTPFPKTSPNNIYGSQNKIGQWIEDQTYIKNIRATGDSFWDDALPMLGSPQVYSGKSTTPLTTKIDRRMNQLYYDIDRKIVNPFRIQEYYKPEVYVTRDIEYFTPGKGYETKTVTFLEPEEYGTADLRRTDIWYQYHGKYATTPLAKSFTVNPETLLPDTPFLIQQQIEYRIPYIDTKYVGSRSGNYITEGKKYNTLGEFEFNKRIFINQPVQQSWTETENIYKTGSKRIITGGSKIQTKKIIGTYTTQHEQLVKDVGYFYDAEAVDYQVPWSQSFFSTDISYGKVTHMPIFGESYTVMETSIVTKPITSFTYFKEVGGSWVPSSDYLGGGKLTIKYELSPTELYKGKTPFKYNRGYDSIKDRGLPDVTLDLGYEGTGTTFAKTEKTFSGVTNNYLYTPELETIERPLTRGEAKLLIEAEEGTNIISSHWKYNVPRIGGLIGLQKNIVTKKNNQYYLTSPKLNIDITGTTNIREEKKVTYEKIKLGTNLWTGTQPIIRTELGEWEETKKENENKKDIFSENASILQSISLNSMASLQKQDLGQELKQEQRQDLATRLDLSLGLELDLDNTLDITTPRPPEPITPRIPTPILLLPEDKEEEEYIKKKKQIIKGTGYNVYVKERSMYQGKIRKPTNFVKMNKKPLNQEDALALGGNITDNSSAISFKLKSTKSKPQKLQELIKPWENIKRKFTKKGEIWIEQNPYRIDTPGEKQNVSARGWQSNKLKGMNNRINNINLLGENKMFNNNKKGKGGKRVRYF